MESRGVRHTRTPPVDPSHCPLVTRPTRYGPVSCLYVARRSSGTTAAWVRELIITSRSHPLVLFGLTCIINHHSLCLTMSYT